MTPPPSTTDLATWLDGAAGRVVQRQATFWDLERSDPGAAIGRVHFGRRAERRFVDAPFTSAALHTTHPLLLEHEEPGATLFVAAPIDDVEAVVAALGEAIASATAGWRRLANYRDRHPSLDIVLRAGFGHVMTAPHSVVRAAMPILERAGAGPHLVDTTLRAASADRHRVLVLGASYIISTTFRLELLPVT